MLKAALAAAVAAALLFASQPDAAAQSEPMDPAVKKKFNRALELFSKKEFKEAAEGFAEVYKQAKRIDVLFAWAQATRLSGDCALALELYRELEREPALGERDRAAVEKGIRKCGAAPNRGDEEGDDAGDGDAGEGGDDATTTDTTPDQPTTGIQASPGADRPWYTDGIGDALLAAGVVTLGFGSGLFVLSASDADAADNAATEAEHVRFEDRAQSRRTLAIITLSAGAALIGGAVYRYVTRDSGASPGGVALWSSGEGGFGVAFGGGF